MLKRLKGAFRMENPGLYLFGSVKQRRDAEVSDLDAGKSVI